VSPAVVHGGIPAREGVEFQAYQDSTQWAWAAAVAVAGALGRALEAEPRACLVSAGGRSRGPA